MNEVKGNLEIIFLGNIDNYHKNIVNEYGLNDIILFKDFMPYHNALSFMAGRMSFYLLEIEAGFKFLENYLIILVAEDRFYGLKEMNEILL